MRRSREPRQQTLSFKVTAEVRRVVELLAARLTESRGQRYTLTDVVEEALREKAKREKVA